MYDVTQAHRARGRASDDVICSHEGANPSLLGVSREPTAPSPGNPAASGAPRQSPASGRSRTPRPSTPRTSRCRTGVRLTRRWHGREGQRRGRVGG